MTPTLTMNDGADATQEHPEALPDEQPESPYGPRNENLPEQLVEALRKCILEFQNQDVYIRRREVIRDRRNRFYERGYQHIWENWKTGGFTQATPGALATNAWGRNVQTPNYIGDYNIFQPYARIIEANLTQNPPGIDFRPDNPNASEDMEAAETAEAYRHMFDRANDRTEIQTQMVRMMEMGGRYLLWTRTEANAQRWGKNADGSPHQRETATVYGTLESKLPMCAKSLEDSLYCFLFDDPDVKQAKAEYPEFRTKIKANMAGLGENAYERTARLGVLQGAQSQAMLGDSFTHLVTRMHAWLRPAAFEGEDYEEPYTPGPDEPETEARTLREKILELFPCGVHVVFVGDVYVGSWDEAIEDALTLGFAYKGDGMFRYAIMDPMVIVQDSFNDAMNAAREIWDMGWPSIWINAEDQDFDAINDQVSQPYAFRQMKLPAGSKVEDSVYREPSPNMPASFSEWIESLQGPLAQFMLACPPALFGEAMQDQKTASGYAQARAQAMGQQSVWWASIQASWASVYRQAALWASKNPDHSEGIVVVGDDGQTQSVEIQKIAKGKFGAYPDEDTGFPETTAAKRTVLGGILTAAASEPAVGQQIMSSPDNWKTFLSVMGFPELKIPEAEARDKQIFEIEELLKQSPLPPSPEQLEAAQIEHAAAAIQLPPGMPAPPFDRSSLLQPSVPVDELDFHAWEFAYCQEWLSSDARRRQDAAGNYPGVQNVKLHALAHRKFLAAALAAAQPTQSAAAPAKAPPHQKPSPPAHQSAPSAPAPATM